MAVLSILRRAFPPIQSLSKSWQLNGSSIQIRNSADRKMNITASRWPWHKFKDLFHFYLMLGIIPLTTLVFLVNIYIGPAQLREIPEGYTPEKWEYYKHPISRWMAKHLYPSHQEEYERYIYFRFEDDERSQMMAISKRVDTVMGERLDSTAYHQYKKPILEHLKAVRENFEEEREYLGIEAPP